MVRSDESYDSAAGVRAGISVRTTGDVAGERTMEHEDGEVELVGGWFDRDGVGVGGGEKLK